MSGANEITSFKETVGEAKKELQPVNESTDLEAESHQGAMPRMKEPEALETEGMDSKIAEPEV